jgi:hypothetical protein
MNKKERQAQLEPLHKQETKIIVQLEEEKTIMTQAHSESATLLQEKITTQIVEALTDKDAQVKEKGKELANKFHSLEKTVQGVHTT